MIALCLTAVGAFGMVATVSDPCGSSDEVEFGGVVQCVHVDDPSDVLAAEPAPSDSAIAYADGATALAVPGSALSRGSTAGRLVCDRTSAGRRVQVLYAHLPGQNNFSGVRADLVQYVARMQTQYDASSSAHGATRVRVPRLLANATATSCELPITPVAISPVGHLDPARLFDELFLRGYDDPNRAYLVFVEEGPACGAGTIIVDDDADPRRNENNARRAPAFSRIDEPCWGLVEAHELGHNLGAVQPSSPHGTEAGHCTDGRDAMCYRDGSATGERYEQSSCPDAVWAYLLDCNGDDYFNPVPRPGSYLDRHWNAVDNDWLMTTFPGASIVGTTVGSNGTPFDDVPIEHVFVRDIARLARSGITKGCNDAQTVFCPTGTVTRGQMAAFLSRALTLPPSNIVFRDTRDHLFRRDIGALAAARITLGCTNDGTLFCPDEPVTRGQMAAFLTRALRLPSGSKVFADANGHLFQDSIAALERAGITKGCNASRTKFCPDDPVTREQMAAFLVRARLTD